MGGTILLSIKSLVLRELSSVDRPLYQHPNALLLQPAASLSCCFWLHSAAIDTCVAWQQGSCWLGVMILEYKTALMLRGSQ